MNSQIQLQRYRSDNENVAVCTNCSPAFKAGADKLVPLEMCGKLFDACTSPKDKFVVAGAGHADCKSTNPTAYFDKIFAFLDTLTK